MEISLKLLWMVYSMDWVKQIGEKVQMAKLYLKDFYFMDVMLLLTDKNIVIQAHKNSGKKMDVLVELKGKILKKC